MRDEPPPVAVDPTLKSSPAARLLADGLQAKWEGNYRAAVELFRAALSLAAEADQRPLLVNGHLNLGNVYREWGDAELAWAHYTEAGEAAVSLPEATQASVANSIAGLAFDRGDVATALEGYA